MTNLEVQTGFLRVLLFEDEPNDRELLEYQLHQVTSRKIELSVCTTLASGLSILSQSLPDLIILDLSLPDSSGVETVRSIHKRCPAVPIIILTGSDDEEWASQALDAGAQDYLIKGQINPRLLSRSINYAIERQRSSILSKWFVALVDNSNDAIIGVSLDNLIMSWNAGAERIFEYSAAEIIGQPLSLLLPETEKAHMHFPFKSDYSEVFLHSRSGKTLAINLSVSPIRDEDGSLAAKSLVARDITREREMEEHLRQADERLKLAIGAAGLGLWDWNVLSNELRWDSGMYALLGLQENAFQPTLRRFLNYVHDADRRLVREAVRKQGVFDFDIRTQNVTTSEQILQMKGEVFCDKDGNPERMSGVCFDISARKAAEKALQVSERRLNLALQSARMGVWDIDLTDGKVSRSQLHNEIFGYEEWLPEWFLKDLVKHTLPEDRERLKAELLEAVALGKISTECRIQRKNDGAVRWIKLQGEAVEADSKGRMIGTISDITERRQLQQTAREDQERSKQILQAVIEHAPIGIVMLDQEFKVVWSNPAFTEMKQCSLNDLVQNSLNVILPFPELQKAALALQDGLPTQISNLEIEMSSQNKHYWDLSLWPMSNSDGAATGAILQVIDRTKTVLLEHQRDDFVASVAHDIKNPLIGAARMLEVLCKQAEDNPPQELVHFLTSLRDSTQNLLSLVQNLVDVYKYQTLSYPCFFEDIPVVPLFDSCVTQVALFAEARNVHLRTNIPESIHSIEADRLGLRRVLMNLLHNAVKFNKDDGTVELKIAREQATIVISISDTGYGISHSDQRNLFKRFAQPAPGKKYSSGSGLGLYLSKQIIEAHQGQIECQSEPGCGSTFIIRLPLKPAVIKS